VLRDPAAHLKSKDFAAQVAMAKAAGFTEADNPRVPRQLCALLQKPKSRADA